MNKIQGILFRTVVPVTIGTTIFVGYFWISDRFTEDTGKISCETFHISNTFYFESIIIVVAITTFYNLTLREILNKKLSGNKVERYLVNMLAFAFYIAGLMLLMSLVNGNKPEAATLITLLLVSSILEVINTIVAFLFRRFILKGN